MNRFRWQILVVVLGAALIALLLMVLKPAGQRPVSSDPIPVRGGEYSEALVGALQRLNPVLDFRNPVDRDVDRLIFSGLIRFDSDGSILPDLADGWSIADEGKTYTLLLRKDALWHDGQPVTSKDVLYTYGLLQSDQYSGPADLASMWRSIKVEAIDDKTVRFTLPEAYAPFLDFLSTGLLPDHLLQGVSFRLLDQNTFNLQPVGTGPFRFESLILNGDQIAGVTLVPFARHYAGVPYLERVRFLYFPSEETAWKALDSGAVMGMGGIRPQRLPGMLVNSQFSLYTAREAASSMVFLNLKNDEVAFFQQREVRKALFEAVNRQGIIDTIFDGQAVAASGPLLPNSWASDANLTPEAYDPDQAVRLLDAAGWVLPTGAEPGTDSYVRQKDSKPLAFTLLVPDDPTHQAVAEAMQKSWAAVGVKVELRLLAVSELLANYLEPRIYQAALLDLDLSPYPDPDPYPFWNDTQFPSGQNYSQFADRSISETLELARIETVPDKRAKLYRNFQYRFNYQVPALCLWHPVYTYIIDARIQDVVFGPLYDPSDRLAGLARWFMMVDQ